MDVVDLVQVGIGGVQRFIAESATTADVANSSAIVQRLAAAAAHAVRQGLAGEGGLVFPVVDEAGGVGRGVTSKIVFRAPAGRGVVVAGAAREAVVAEWAGMVRGCFGEVVATPGFPEVWWVSVRGPAQPYAVLWRELGEAVAGRRRSRVFEPLVVTRSWLSTQSPGLPSVAAPKRGVRGHERRERLSAQGWVKRLHGRGSGPATRSTWSIATTGYRVALLADPPAGLAEAVQRLLGAVAAVTGVRPERVVTEAPVAECGEALRPLATQLGGWVDPLVWQQARLRRDYGPSVTAAAVTDGARAAREIANLAAGVGIAAPSPWFAVVMQDLDRLGRALGNLDADGQAEASRMLVGLAGAHRAAIERDAVPGVAIYTGGDDVLAFCPPQRALELARQLRDLTTRHVGASGLRDERGAPVTASSAVVFAPVGMGMQAVLTHAREALEEAKTARGHGVSANRDAVAVVGLLGGGVRVRSVQPWSVDPVAQWSMLRPDAAVLSAGLAAQLERDRTELEELAAHATLAPVLRAELERLIGRRGGDPAHAEALLTLARHERHHPDTAGERAWFAPVPAVVLARFLAQKAS